MALYNDLTTGEITAKEPVTETLLTKVKDNFSNHESRLLVVEATQLTTGPMTFVVDGPQYIFGAQNGIVLIRAPYAMTLTGAKLGIASVGSSGTLTVDVRRSAAGGGAFSTIFSTKPSVAVAAGSYAVSTNAVISDTTVAAGDLFLLDVTVVQVGLNYFYLQLTHSVA